jgi:hypothetical protein
LQQLWIAVVTDQQINPVPDSGGYPVLGALDINQQLGTQGIGLLPTVAAIEVDGADNTTINNVTVGNGN